MLAGHDIETNVTLHLPDGLTNHDVQPLLQALFADLNKAGNGPDIITTQPGWERAGELFISNLRWVSLGVEDVITTLERQHNIQVIGPDRPNKRQ